MKISKSVRKIIAAVTVVALMTTLVICSQVQAQDEFTENSFEFISKINCGINVGNSLDVAEVWGGETVWGNPKVTQKTLDTIKAKGFNAVRIPITWYGEKAEAPYTITSTTLSRAKEVVDYAMNNDLYVIINMHHEGKWLNPEDNISDEDLAEKMAQYKAGWEQIAETFKDYGEKLMFEASNELGNGSRSDEKDEQINLVNKTFVETVRASGGNNSQRFLVLKAYYGGANELSLNNFTIPEDEANHLIFSFHAYLPTRFCMTQAGQYESTDVTSFSRRQLEVSLEDTLEAVNNKFIKNGIPVIIGEMGSINKNNKTDRLNHVKAYIEIVASYGIKCFWWDNGSTRVNSGGSDTAETFGLYNRNTFYWTHGDIADAMIEEANKYVGALPNAITTTEEPTTAEPTTAEPTTAEPTTEPEITYGDANGDGKVTAADVLLIRKYLAKWEVADLIDLDTADANADGKVTAADVLLIRKYLAKWKNIELGTQK